MIKVGITQGDFNGIGLEVTLKALADEMITDLFIPVIFADNRLVNFAIRELGIELPKTKVIEKAADARQGVINIVDLKLQDVQVTAGTPTQSSGRGAVESLERAVHALQAGEIDVLVTAPISKEACQSDDFKFTGHTEYLNAKAGKDHRAQMILFDDLLRVALVSTHVPVSKISEVTTRESVERSIGDFAITLRRDFSIRKPKIAVLSLNPHTGDGGLLGTEERDVIVPAIEACVEAGVQAFGPFAADGFFGSGAYRNFDGVLAMYHDQGLAPFKALSGDAGVNYTAGLPFVRTSPDHGTAFDIAWKGHADPLSMRQAIYKAIDIFRCRKMYDKAAANPLAKHSMERAPKGDRNQQKSENPPTDTEK